MLSIIKAGKHGTLSGRKHSLGTEPNTVRARQAPRN